MVRSIYGKKGMQRATDEEVIKLAGKEGQVILTKAILLPATELWKN